MMEDVAVRAQRAGVTPADMEFRPNIDTNRFRRKRFAMFLDHVERSLGKRDEIRILDVGGSRAYWLGHRDMWEHLPFHITIINIGSADQDDPPYYLRDGDALNMAYGDDSFDMVHSNSVIEHVGHWPEMSLMAGEIRRVSRHHFIQTPNYGFPIEPHYRAPFFHWLPESVRASMLMKRRLGFCGPAENFDAAMRHIQAVNLVTYRQMRALFPDSRIERERVFGFTKSLIAIR